MSLIKNKQRVAEAWEHFVANNETETDRIYVRDYIYKSWLRSRQYSVNPFKIETTVLNREELKKRIERRSNLVNIARAYMQNLFRIVKGSGFLVLLCDEEGFVLEVIGDEEISVIANKTNLEPGANRSERTVGTNAIGTCLHNDSPLQVFAEEHYYKGNHHWTCSAAPIHDKEGNILGCINLTGPWEKVHAHTLGMVVSVVAAIEEQMSLQQAYNEINLVNSQLRATVEGISDGIIVVNDKGRIVHINNKAVKMIGVDNDVYLNTSIDELLEAGNYFYRCILNDWEVFDKEKSFKINNRLLHCTVTVSHIKNVNDVTEGLVVILKEMKFVRKLVNRMTGSQARFVFDNVVGNSEQIKETIRIARIAANTSSNVLLLGESGTGKELFAQAIHNQSERKEGPFIAINCGAIPRGLIESELFGYEGGAFTGSRKEGHPGKFELADGGTVFLDEIGDMPLDIQVSLLRVLQNKEVIRVGSNNAKRINVRIISATNKDLEKAVDNREFRSDLFFRLNVFTIMVPSLRNRREDIPILTEYFINQYNKHLDKKVKGIDKEVEKIFLEYPWPGNVRELENTLERAMNITQFSLIGMNDLPQKLKKIQMTSIVTYGKTISSSVSSLKDIESDTIHTVLVECKGNIKRTAEALGMGRKTLYKKCQIYNLDYTKYRNK